MSKFLRVLIGVTIIILLIFLALFLGGGNIEGEAVLFLVFIFASIVSGCGIGVLLIKAKEKNTGEKLTYNAIRFYIGLPCCIFMFIAICLFNVLVN